MTALCGGGTSQPQPTAPVTVVLTVALAASFLPEDVVWVLPFLPFLGTIVFDLPGYCGTDPPAIFSVPNAAEFVALAERGATASTLAVDFIKSVVQYYYWFTVCECVTGGPPVVPPGPAAPIGLPGVNTPGAGYGTATPCLSVTGGPFATPYPNDVGDFIAKAPVTGTNIAYSTLPVGATSVRITGNVQSVGTVHPNVNFYTVFYHQLPLSVPNQTGSVVLNGVVSGTTGTLVGNVPPNSVYYQFYSQNGATAGANDLLTGTADFFCGGQAPGQQLEPCCPPDPNILAILTSIQGEIETLLSRPGPSIAYTLGRVHAGLTGSASISVSGLRGVLVQITAGSPSRPPLVGNPPYLWDMGWISAMDNNGFIDEKRLTRTTQVWTPRLGTNATTIGYYLDPGVTATITELVPA